jgi:hypothetical protein
VPELKPHTAPDILEEVEGNNGHGVMAELTRVSARLTESEEGKIILPKLFEYFEQALVLKDEVIDFLIFSFSDDPTGKSPEIQKLLPWIGPRLKSFMGI